MRYRQLGSSDLKVSEIGLGSWLTVAGGVSREQAKACLTSALDIGITFFDTANSYGHAEELLGEVLSGRPRDSYVLATKVGWSIPKTRIPGRIARRIPLGLLEPDKGLSRGQIFKQIDRSLRRLRTDYVDLYQCHRYDWETPLEETMDALTEIVRQGKARYLGFSEWPVQRIEAALQLPDVDRFVSSQPQYSMIWRGPERELIPYCREHGISQVVFSPLSQGILTGKYGPGQQPPEGSRATSSEMNMYMDRARDQTLLDRVQRVKELADELGTPLAQLALAWVLRQPNVASAITGATSADQVELNAAASGIDLDRETIERIDDILADSVAWEAPDS